MSVSILPSMRSIFQALLSRHATYFVIDLGTANTLIHVHNKGVVVNEPTMIAINKRVNKVVAIGKEAQKMRGKTPQNIDVIKPLEFGVINDFEATKRYLKILLSEQFDNRLSLFRSINVLTSCPPLTSDIELKALEDVFYELEFSRVMVIKETLLSAIGVGLDVMAPKPSFIVDMGGGTINIALIALGETIIEKALKTAGSHFDNDIKKYIETKFDLIIGDETAERIKILMGSAIELEKRLEMRIAGKIKDSLMPGEITINDIHIRAALSESLEYIVEEIKDALKKIPPEFTKELLRSGIHLTGGSSQIRGLTTFFERHLGLAVHTPANPLTSIIQGGIVVFKNPSHWEPLYLSIS